MKAKRCRCPFEQQVRQVLEGASQCAECGLDIRFKKPQALTEQWWFALIVTVAIVGTVVGVLLWNGADGAQRSVAWDANSESNLAGYRVYLNGRMVVQTAATSASIEAGPGDGITVSAYDTEGLESAQSAMVVIPAPDLDRTGWEIAGVSSEESAKYAAPLAIDGKPDTFWHTRFSDNIPPPHSIVIRLPRAATVSGISYLPRQDGSANGNIQRWEIQSSLDGIAWESWEQGDWAHDQTIKNATLPLREVRYFRLWGNEDYCNAAEIHLNGSYVPDVLMVELENSPDLLSPWTALSSSQVPALPKQFFRLKFPTPDGRKVKVTYQVEMP